MEILARGAAELGLQLTDHQLDQFEVYYRELADWNQRMNLTSIIEYSEVQVKHFLDSLTVCLALPGGLAPGAAVVEVGAGAGLPGLALKLVFPDSRLALVESVAKKTAFLRHLVEVLALDRVEVYTGRAEEMARHPELRESFDLVLARGLAKMPALLEYTLPFCRVGGRVVAWKHGGIDDELAGAARALNTLGGRLTGVLPVGVTGLTDNRVLVVVDKVKPTPPAYPRRAGVPAKQPL
jgi:16S rRNA (guanine527-N7)-methyltransferase